MDPDEQGKHLTCFEVPFPISLDGRGTSQLPEGGESCYIRFHGC